MLFYVDNKPPEVKIEPEREFVNLSGKVFSLQNNLLTLEAKDRESGVNRIEYRLNSSEFVNYDRPVLLSKSGENILEVKAYDNVGNISEIKQLVVWVDEKPPESTLMMINPGQESQ